MSDDQMRERLAAARRKMRERDSQWRNDATDVWFSESEADDLWAASVAGVLAADGLVITTQEQACHRGSGGTAAEASRGWAGRPMSDRPHPETTCQRCDGPNPSWHAASPLWNAVVREPDGADRWGILCPSCFAALANEQGHHVCLTVHGDLPADPHGRTFDRAACRWPDPEAPTDE